MQTRKQLQEYVENQYISNISEKRLDMELNI